MKAADKVVAYFYDEESGNYTYGYAHPWRPHRTKLVHSLVDGYGLPGQMLVHRPQSRSFDQLTEFHADGELMTQSLAVLHHQQQVVWPPTFHSTPSGTVRHAEEHA